MMKLVYLPLDERPCNLKYPQQLAAATDIQLFTPSKQILGRKKNPAKFEDIRSWLLRETKEATHLILSLDMLVYGGIVPSRLHQLTDEECVARLDVIKEIKQQNQRIIIYAFNLIMRVPSYNSSDEEPDYYAIYGERISHYGKLLDKKGRGELLEQESEDFILLKQEIPVEILKDFTNRRRTNSATNLVAIDLVQIGLIDFLIFPLDDNAEYGFSAMEQSDLLFKVEQLQLMDRIAIYPGADEIGCTLFSKVFCEIHQYTPALYVRYSSTNGPFIIPKYEDRSLQESIKSHLTASGAVMVDHSLDADAVLFTHSPAVGQSGMAEPNQLFSERHRSYFSEINYREFIQAMQFYLSKNMVVGIADVATCNGSDQTLMYMLKKQGLLEKISAYAGWNTSGNSLGTVIAHTIIESYYHKMIDYERIAKSREFYYSRLVEDWGYQTIVRKQVATNDIPRLGCTYFDISSQLEVIQSIIKQKLEQFIKENLSNPAEGRLKLENVTSPWKRMFEVDFHLSYVMEKIV